MKFNTLLLHGCKDVIDAAGATLPPIYQNSAFGHKSAEALERVFENKAPGFAYTRIGNPTVDAFERRMAFVEGGMSATACASGMAAISMTLLGILQSGDEVISSSALFGGTLDLFDDLERFGIHAHLVEDMTAEAVEARTTQGRIGFRVQTVDTGAENAMFASPGDPVSDNDGRAMRAPTYRTNVIIFHLGRGKKVEPFNGIMSSVLKSLKIDVKKEFRYLWYTQSFQTYIRTFTVLPCPCRAIP
ncbi:MAG: PLP-dependent transferase [Synergistaceae bacterium]|jgi:hypothetical protein|nr:PLP-dependent transferase [Synergistaceae bacterium]